MSDISARLDHYLAAKLKADGAERVVPDFLHERCVYAENCLESLTQRAEKAEAELERERAKRKRWEWAAQHDAYLVREGRREDDEDYRIERRHSRYIEVLLARYNEEASDERT